MKTSHFTNFLILTIAFFLMTIIGTLSHEMGHFLAGKYFGWDVQLHYASVSTKSDSEIRKEIKHLHQMYNAQIRDEENQDIRLRYYKLLKQSDWESFIFTLAGPLQTVTFGSIGFLLLLLYRNQFIADNKVRLSGWLLIFLTLF